MAQIIWSTQIGKLLVVAGGGAIGVSARYLVYLMYQRYVPGSFPYGTLTVNCLGCLGIGVIGAALHATLPEKEQHAYHLFLIVGILGGFTTFSSFGFDTLKLIDAGRVGHAVLYVLASNGLGLLAVWAGYRAAMRAFGK